MRSLSFTMRDEGVVATITVTEIENGDLRFDIDLAPKKSDEVADLQRLSFNVVTDGLLPGLAATGSNVSSNPDFDGGGPFEAEIRFFGQDLEQTSFVLSHDSQDLTLDLISQQSFGLRGKVREDDDDDTDKLRMSGTAPVAPVVNVDPVAADDTATTDA